MTHLIQQYTAIKAKYKDAILLFRVGDFYETFNEDAETVALHMRIPLAIHEQKPDIKAAASLSHYHLHDALRILTRAGYKVAVCDQLKAPKAGPTKRGVTDLLEPE
ncbi:MAG: hypothetical protein INR73_08085 [Williamsia sp.]|nr:hypothetical protein [Williamsia sp.]